jgi:nitroreductase
MQPHADLHDPIAKRYSPMIFQDKPISDEDLELMLEAARWAPSSFNEQPWRFIVGQNKDETWEKIFETLDEGNQAWAKHAPVLMITATKLTFDFDGRPNRHAYHDVGLAVENMIIQAMTQDIYSHQMAGFDQMKARQLFEIPDGFDPVAAGAFGYAGNPDDLEDEDLKERAEGERKRNAKAGFVFSGTWGNAHEVA